MDMMDIESAFAMTANFLVQHDNDEFKLYFFLNFFSQAILFIANGHWIKMQKAHCDNTKPERETLSTTER